VVISELNTWPVCTPVNASPASLRTQAHDSEQDGEVLLSCAALSSATPCRFNPGAFLDHFVRSVKHRLRNRETDLLSRL
jgi:hypothetical protein